uniref:Palmitoyl-protein thioesterase 1 n=1 Tax=Culicoides sonorensis TaxID=179676 RepID=A0A336MSF6_CULSO
MKEVTIQILLFFVVGTQFDRVRSDPVPIVLWHGMGDSCCFPFSLGGFKKQLEAEIPGVYVHSLKIGGNLVTDYESGYFIHPNKQIEEVCSAISNNTKLSNGFNAIGFSQGGQFLRALQQRCSTVKIFNLISLGGQHQGVFGLPDCPSLSSATCEYLRESLNYGAYLSWMQKFLVQATYWHDPLHEDKYRNFSTFLADINNEREINQEYVENLKRLKRLVLVKFMNDTIVQPRESQWFGFYRPGQDEEVIEMEETDLYKNDRLGLKSMKASGHLFFLETEGNHLQFTKEWFVKNILPILTEEQK